MANISSAHGTLTLEGYWTQEAVDVLRPVLDSWEFEGEYGLTVCAYPDLEHRKVDFNGTGRWGFSSMLTLDFPVWMEDWIKSPLQDPLPAAYRKLIALMYQEDLTIWLSFADWVEDFPPYRETGRFVSDGISLLYARQFSDEYEEQNRRIFLQKGGLEKYEGPGGEVTLPENVTIIGGKAFRDRTDITSVILPQGLREIQWCAFENCSSLSQIKIPEGVRSIGWGAFSKCIGLKKIVLPENLREIGSEAFQDCTGLEHVSLSAATKVGSCAFRNTPWLTSLGEWAVVNGVLHAYQGKQAEVVVPNKVWRIDEEAFCGQKKLQSVVLPDGLKEIGADAFRKCKKLRTLDIPEGVEKIGSGAFAGSGLTNITLPSGLKELELGLFAGCEDLTQVVLPTGLEVIYEGAFSNCRSLAAIRLPMSVRWIQARVFDKCTGLTSIDIPPQVTELYQCTFRSCTNLTCVQMSNVQKMKKDTFQDCPNLTIRAPEGSAAQRYAERYKIPFQAL